LSSFCLGCGNSMAEGERFCSACGRDAQTGVAVPLIDPGVAFGFSPETSGKAIFSLICGLLFIVPPASLMAVIFGHLAISDIRKSAGRFTGRGLAVVGIVLGYVGVACFLGFIGFVIYEVREDQKRVQTSQKAHASQQKIHISQQAVYSATSENSAVSSVRSLNIAEIAYSQAHKDEGYTCSLAHLSSAWGLSADLASGKKNGYIFRVQDCSSAKPNGPIVKYRVVAYPTVPGKNAVPAYCSDESDLIRVARSGSPLECLERGADLADSEVSPPKTWQPSQ
jgi:Domain of unknown function (DUF4190)